MTTLVVSPHLDDAVLSLPGCIRTLALRGERVVVLTVCSEGDVGHATRRAEDLAALALLGAVPLQLGLRDAPQRRSITPSFRELVLRELTDDDIDAATVTRALALAIAEVGPSTTLLPLGVGEHIDHRIVHAAHTGLAGRVGFYEDRPYALIQHAVRARQLRLGAVVDGAAVTPCPAAVDEFLAAARVAPHIHAYLAADEREDCLARLAATLTRASPPSGLALRSERLRFTPAVRSDAARAVQAYASQLADLFGADDITARFAEPYAERIYWRADGPD